MRIEPPIRDARAGRRALRRIRTMGVALLAVVGFVGAGKASAQPAAPGLLTPTLTLSGAQLSGALDPAGNPVARPMFRGYQRFVRPVSVAGRGADTYVADIGTGAVYRFDAQFNVMTPLPGIRAQTGVQLHVGNDLSVYVLDQAGRRVLHFARSGQLLATFVNDLELARPVDIALDAARGRVLVADGLHNHLVAFHPLGQASVVLSPRRGANAQVFGIAGVAVAGNAIYVSDPMGGSIAQLAPDGTVLGTFGHNELQQPGPIAVDYSDRVFVVDTFDGSLKVFAQGELVHDIAATQIGLQRISDVWVDDGGIVVTDGSGATVKFFRVAPPAAQ